MGNGHLIQIRGCGHTNLPPPNPPLASRNVLHASKLIKTLISVRKFTTDNYVAIEFDLYGFSVKGFRMGVALMRCGNWADLYPITTIKLPTTTPSTFVDLSSPLWHDRSDHTRTSILDCLRLNKSI